MPHTPSHKEEPEQNQYTGGGPPTGTEGGQSAIVQGPRIAQSQYLDPSMLQYLPMRPGAAFEQVELPIERFEKYFEHQQNLIGNLDPGTLSKLQADLAVTALLQGDYAEGVPDPKTKDAFGDLLGIANTMQMSWRQALRVMLAQVSISDAKKRGYKFNPNTGKYELIEDQFLPPPMEIQLPNRKDVDAVVRRASIEMTGQGWSQERIAKLTDAYLNEVTQAQEDEYHQRVEAARAEFEGTPLPERIVTTEPPSIGTFAEQQIRERAPEEYMRNQGMELLLGVINQWGGVGG